MIKNFVYVDNVFCLIYINLGNVISCIDMY